MSEEIACNADIVWRDENEEPTQDGWYLVDAVDGRFKYRACGKVHREIAIYIFKTRIKK